MTTQPTSEMIEAVARAICTVASRRGASHPDEPVDYGWEEWIDEAKAAIAAMGEFRGEPE